MFPHILNFQTLLDSRDVDNRQKDSLLAAIAYSQDQVRFSVKQQSKFLVSLLPCLQSGPFQGVAAS